MFFFGKYSLLDCVGLECVLIRSCKLDVVSNMSDIFNEDNNHRSHYSVKFVCRSTRRSHFLSHNLLRASVHNIYTLLGSSIIL